MAYCAPCGGALPAFRNQLLVAVGGGDSACEEAMDLPRFGSVVHFIHRRDSLGASMIMAERTLANGKIKPVWNTVVTEILDVHQDKVTGVKVKNLETNLEYLIPCTGVFVAIVHVPNTKLFQPFLQTDEHGYIMRTTGASTNVPGVFVAGDYSDRLYRQAITAAGMGCAAAIEAERFLASPNS